MASGLMRRSIAPLASKARTSEANRSVPSGRGVVERLDAESIAGKQHARAASAAGVRAGLAAAVPKGEGKHAAQMLEAAFAPLFVTVDDDFGVGVRAEMVAARFERRAEMREIVDFAVEDDADRAVFVVDGLMAAAEIDDAQAAHA